MWQFVRSGGVAVAVVVAAWRGVSELVARYRALAASGELALRLDARRLELVTAALARTRASELVRVPVAAGFGQVVDGRTHASVHVGSLRGIDVDDVGLLEGAMRRAASERMDVSATGVRRRAARRARRIARQGEVHVAAEVLAATPEPTRGAIATRPPRRDGGWTDWRWLAGDDAELEARERAITWQLPAVLCGAALTVTPLVRPLADAAPWLAVAGLALVLAGWFGARRS